MIHVACIRVGGGWKMNRFHVATRYAHETGNAGRAQCWWRIGDQGTGHAQSTVGSKEDLRKTLAAIARNIY